MKEDFWAENTLMDFNVCVQTRTRTHAHTHITDVRLCTAVIHNVVYYHKTIN